MNFQPRDLTTHLDTWLTVMREQMNNATSIQLKRLFTAEVEILEQLIDGFKVGDYKLVDAANLAFMNINTGFGIFGSNNPHLCDFGHPCFVGVDPSAFGTDSTVVSHVKVNEAGVIERTIIPNDKFFKDYDTCLREVIAKLTKLPAVQVRIIMTQMKDKPLRDVVYECLRRYGQSIAGKGESVGDAATYYANYHIERVMKELGE